MITAVDTNVLLDVFGADRSFGFASKESLRESILAGRLVVCEVVLAEVGGIFPTVELAQATLASLQVEFIPMDDQAAYAAATAWKEYRRGGGRRDRVIADFLIGAHALRHADRLLTRDRGFYRNYFAELRLVDPTDSRTG